MTEVVSQTRHGETKVEDGGAGGIRGGIPMGHSTLVPGVFSGIEDIAPVSLKRTFLTHAVSCKLESSLFSLRCIVSLVLFLTF